MATRRRFFLRFWFSAACLAGGLALVPERAAACPFCGVGPTLAGDIDAASVAVIAQLRRRGADSNSVDPEALKAEFAIVRVVKGRELLGTTRTVRTLYFAEAQPDANFLVLGNDPPNLRWATPIALSPRAWVYLRTLRELPRQGAERLTFVFDYLEDREPMLGRDAYDEFALAPFNVLRDLAPRLKPDVLVARLKNPNTPVPLMRLYFTMLSTCGQAEHVAMLEEMMRSDKPQYRGALDALLACYLRLKGADGLPLVERLFLRSEAPDDAPRANAAIMALRFQGQENDVIPRARVIESMRSLMAMPQLAGRVLADLARWEDWSVIDRAAEMFIQADGNSRWVREPVVGYLRACPLPAAKAQLGRLAKIDPETVKRGSAWYYQDTTSRVYQASKKGTAGKAAGSTAGVAASQKPSLAAAGRADDEADPAEIAGAGQSGLLPVVLSLAGGLLVVVLLGVVFARRRNGARNIG